jgi:hypothetical protein
MANCGWCAVIWEAVEPDHPEAECSPGIEGSECRNCGDCPKLAVDEPYCEACWLELK